MKVSQRVVHVHATDAERELREAALRLEVEHRVIQLALAKAQLRLTLSQLPVLGEEDIAIVLDVPRSTLVAIRAADGATPSRFRIGRRYLTRNADLMAYLAEISGEHERVRNGAKNAECGARIQRATSS